jgi:hypothetical protein
VCSVAEIWPWKIPLEIDCTRDPKKQITPLRPSKQQNSPTEYFSKGVFIGLGWSKPSHLLEIQKRMQFPSCTAPDTELNIKNSMDVQATMVS